MLNLEILISTFGLLGIFAIIFLESGAFFAFFLPGDSLLFSAGFLAFSGKPDILPLLLGCLIASFLGLIMGYLFGKKVGNKIFQKKSSMFFNPKNLEKTHIFYQKYGKLTIVVSRFVPVVRTFAPILAGVGEMNFKTFLLYDALGSILWVGIMTGAGYFLGSRFPQAHDFILPVVGGLFLLTFIPIGWGIWKNYQHNQENKNLK
ncbi:MAG: DedA family protein [bacterium]|nr:DedA family protein [bacterium]